MKLILPAAISFAFITPSYAAEQLGATQEKSFSFAVMADTQAFRLDNGGAGGSDPNSESQSGAEWRARSNKLVSALNATPDVAFGIINGDVTEFGRANSWLAVFSIFGKLKFPYLFGLGNHDYEKNVGDCWDGIWFSMDGCALRSVNNMQDQFGKYRSQFVNFTADWIDNKGSLAYSWDYNGVHFVQLQNHPAYKVKLHGPAGVLRYDVLPSLSWLAEDLRKARLRGVKDIILNLHQYQDDFKTSANDYARRQFQAIMLTYKPLAVFAGHHHQAYKTPHSNHPFYGNTTVYSTGAAFNADYHLVTYDNGKLTVREMAGISGKPVLEKTYIEQPQPTPAICKIAGKEGKSGEVYISTFLSKDRYWNLRQVLATGNNVDANANGSAYMRVWNEGNPYQLWSFEKANGDSWPEFNSWYFIRQLQTKKVLDSNAAGSVYTNEAKSGNAYQQWRPLKTERGELLLVNRATNRLLDGNGSSLYTTPGYEMFNHYKVWQLSQGWNRLQPSEVRYFKALSDSAWKSDLPAGKSSNANWLYLSNHDYLSASPCIGW